MPRAPIILPRTVAAKLAARQKASRAATARTLAAPMTRITMERAIDAALVRFLKSQRDGLSHRLELAEARLAPGAEGPLAKAAASRDEIDALIEAFAVLHGRQQ